MDISWQHIDDAECRRFQSSIELVGKRWSSAILMAVGQGASRFSEIIATVPGLSDRLLSQRARELESSGLLAREVIPTTPVQVRYALTERGSDLLNSLQPLVTWGEKWGTPITGKSPRSDDHGDFAPINTVRTG